MTELDHGNAHAPDHGQAPLIPAPRPPRDDTSTPPGVWRTPADNTPPDTEPGHDDSGEGAEEGAPPALVDRGADTGPDRLAALLASRRLPVLPDWAASLSDARRTLAFVRGHAWHVARFHAVRVPWYALRLTGRAPRGAARILRTLVAWVADTEGRPLISNTIEQMDAAGYLRLSDRHSRRVRARLALAGAPTLAAVIWWLAAAPHLPAPELGAAVAALVGLLGWRGAPPDKPLTSRAVVKPQYLKLTSDVVLRALGSLGIPELRQAVEKGGRGLAFVTPIAVDGPGWRAELDLPFGVTAVDVMEKRRELASGLRRPLGCVWPEPVHDEHSGRLVIWVGREEMRKALQPAWPLAKRGTGDVFAPQPFGTDQRGRTVYVTLAENNVLVGALPGGGKSFSIQPLIYAAALDPTVQVWSVNLKGDGFHKNTARFAARYVDGIDDEAIEAALGLLRELKAEVIRRTTVFKNLGPALNPDGKINRTIANRPSLGLPPLVAFFDEVQNLFAHARYGKEAGELAEFIIKVGRSLGVWLILATQRPDKDSIPTGVSANASIRFCLRVMGQTENDMILGTSAYKNGIRATQFTTADKGIGYLVGAAEEPQIARTFFLDQHATAKLAERARALREQAGTLTGHALDPDAHQDGGGKARTVLDDLGELFPLIPFTNDKVRGEELLTLLTDHNPDAYTGWGVETLTAALKPHGVRSVDVSRREGGTQTVRKGYERAALATAVTKRHRDGESD